MADQMTNSFIQALERRDTLSNEERDILIHLAAREVEFKTGEDIVAVGSRPNVSSLIITGIAARYCLATADASSAPFICRAISWICTAFRPRAPY